MTINIKNYEGRVYIMGVLQRRYSYYQHSSKFLTPFVTMKKKIKTWLIHLLGGVTVSESQEHYKSICYNSAYISLTIVKKYSESLYGTPADEWCKLMYKQICRQLDSVTHGTDEEIPTGK